MFLLKSLIDGPSSALTGRRKDSKTVDATYPPKAVLLASSAGLSYHSKKVSRSPTCMMHPALADVILPTAAEEMLGTGATKLRWLKKLKSSQRNCVRSRSWMGSRLNRPKSRFYLPGEIIVFRPLLA
jgi:hypothetical protein